MIEEAVIDVEEIAGASLLLLGIVLILFSVWDLDLGRLHVAAAELVLGGLLLFCWREGRPWFR